VWSVFIASVGSEATAVAVLGRLYQDLSAGTQCTEEVARMLLKVMTENCRELETHHQRECAISIIVPQ